MSDHDKCPNCGHASDGTLKEGRLSTPATCSIIALCLLVIAGWIVTPLLLPKWAAKSTNAAGTFGDQFGATNAIYSGLAMLGVVVSLFLQRRDLRLQWEALQQSIREMRLQERSLKRSATELQTQTELLRAQTNDQRFVSRMGSQPFLSIDVHWLSDHFRVACSNLGARVYDVEVACAHDPDNADRCGLLKEGDRWEPSISTNRIPNDDFTLSMVIGYTTQLGHRMEETFVSEAPRSELRFKGRHHVVHSCLDLIAERIQTDLGMAKDNKHEIAEADAPKEEEEE